jgi:hypothetical protein
MEMSISFFIVDDESKALETLSKSLAFFLPMLKSLERQTISMMHSVSSIKENHNWLFRH